MVNSIQTLEPVLDEMEFNASITVTRGPYCATNDADCSRPTRFNKPRPGHTPQIVPTAKFASTIDEPSSGSKATEYPEFAPQSTSSVVSSDEAKIQTPRYRIIEIMIRKYENLMHVIFER